MAPRKRIAIVGTGISGLSAAWHLNRFHDVTLFEQGTHVGGHSNTVDIELEGKQVPVDTGFIVYNPQNYPNLTALFEHLNVPNVATDMSFSASMNEGRFEYAGGDNWGMLAQPSNLFRPRFWRMVSGILRFYKHAQEYQNAAEELQLTLRELLQLEGFSDAFVADHLGPMGAAIWSSDGDSILDYPAASFLKFFRNHGLTQLKDRPQWRTVKGGSREYVRRLTADFSDQIHLETPVASVRRLDNKVMLTTKDGTMRGFDDIVLACHSDQALALLQDASEEEVRCLSKMRYSKNSVVLHTDRRWLPKRKRAWASWNYIEAPEGTGGKGPAVTYWMNRLQHLPLKTPVLVTLNPFEDVDPAHTLGRYEYDHPIFDQAAAVGRRSLMNLQGANRTWFCGAYLGDGFHEDGIQSGLAIAEMISGEARPWAIAGQNARIGLPDNLLARMAAQ